MLDKLTYVNHLNESVSFGARNILIDKNNLRDYEWSYNSQYDKITGFKRGVSKRKLPVLIYGEQRNSIANRMFEIMEKDILANTPGKLYSGDYYLQGYFYGSTKTDYNDKRFLKLTLNYISTQTKWIYSKKHMFGQRGSNESGLGYPFDYPFDYSSPVNAQTFINTSFVPSNFIIQVYGPVTNPSVIIGGNVHKINVEVQVNEYLTIDSLNKNAVKTARDGSKTNVYPNRDLGSYLFEKIKNGSNSVVISPPCAVDITILEERSEPAWT